MHETWAQVFTPENENTEQAQGPRKPCKIGYIGGPQGDPLCGCKNGSKTEILNKGLNKERLA